MRRLLLLSTLLLAVVATFGQMTNLVFFTEQGERFQVVLNGLLQNPDPETNVKVTGLPAPSYKLKIIFEDQKIGEVDKTLYFNQGTETTFVIKQNKKGEYVVRHMNEVPIAQALPPAPAQQVVVFSTAPARVTTTTTTTSTTGNTGANLGIHINDSDAGANINMDVNIGGMGIETTSSTTTTTTTTTTSSGYGADEGYVVRQGPVASEQHYIMQGYNGPYGCSWPMSPADFEQAKHSIASKDFEDSKLTIAKQIINSNCLLSSQVREIMLIFSYEDSRLDFAKYAYAFTLDLGNYYKVNDAFSFETSIDELNQYIQHYRR